MRKKVYERSELGAYSRLQDQGFEENYRYMEGTVVSSDPGGNVSIQTGGGQSSIVAKNKNGFTLNRNDQVLLYRSIKTGVWNVVAVLYSGTGGRNSLSSSGGTFLDGVAVTDLAEDATSTAELLPGSGIDHKILALYLRRGLTGAGITSVLASTLLPNQSPTTSLSDVPDAYHRRLNLGLPRAVAFAYGTTTQLLPSQSPAGSLSTDSNGDKTLNLSIPRAQRMSFATPTQIAAGGTPTVSTTLDGNGDQVVTLGLVDGADGGAGGSETLLDDVLPAANSTKTYTQIVDADEGSLAPFQIPAGISLDSITAKGYWEIINGTVSQVTNAPGIVQSGYPNQGKLLFGTKPTSSDDLFTYSEYTDAPVDLPANTYLKFAQNRNNSGDKGAGWLLVTYTLIRGNIDWEIVMDFRTASFSGCVTDQFSSLTWASGDGYVTDGTLWYGILSIGLTVTSTSRLKRVITQQRSIHSAPGSGEQNQDRLSVNVAGTTTTYYLSFDYPLSVKTRNMDLLLSTIGTNANIVQFGADTRAVSGATESLTLERIILQGTGQEPTLSGC